MVIRVLCLGLCVMLQGGCVAVGWVADVAIPKTVEAEFKPKDQITAVLVDDFGDRLPNLRVMGEIAAHVGAELKDQQVITQFIDPRTMYDLKLNNKDFKKWSVKKIGESVGAKQVIVVMIEEFEMKVTEGVYKPRIKARVRMVDVATGNVLYPAKDSYGKLVQVEMDHTFTAGTDVSKTAEQVMARRVGQRLALASARLFYKWDRNDDKPGDKRGLN